MKWLLTQQLKMVDVYSLVTNLYYSLLWNTNKDILTVLVTIDFNFMDKKTLLIFLRSTEERHSYRIRNWVWLNDRIVIFDDLIFTKPSFAPSLLKLFCNICGYYSKTLLENQVLIFLSGRNRIKTDLNVYFLEHIICFVSVCVLQVLIRGIRPTLLILGRQRIKIICNVFTNLHNSCCFCKIKTPKH